jgi:hypothetical protein
MTGLTLALVALFAPPPASQPVAASQPAAASQPTSVPAAVKTADGAEHRGAPFTITEQITLDAIAANPKAFEGKTVKVAGKVSAVCKKKGCWMTLAGASSTARARVVFKDYAFFVPLDCQDKLAVLEGKVEAKTLDEAERKHLAEDAGKPISAIPKAELRLIATGVEIRAIGH